MTINPLALQIRAKKLGVLVQDARLASRKRVEECAQVIGVSPATFEAFELGEDSPSLPQLEVLAYFLDLPLDHFWGDKAISEESHPSSRINLEQLFSLRQRMIGVLLLQARSKAGLPIEEAAGRVGISPRELEAYELGEASVPLPVLEALCAALDRPLEDFHDRHGPVGAWMVQQSIAREFLELPIELQEFVCKPINRPYLELAQRLSEMSVEKLRAVAEGLLEITL